MFRRNEITDKGFDAFAKNSEKLPNLKELDFTTN